MIMIKDQAPRTRIAYFIQDGNDGDEFAPAMESLARVIPAQAFESIGDAIRTPSSIDPELILLGQSYRGQFPPQQIIPLRSRFPISRIVCLVGSWCEGETRSGTPISGVERWRARDLLDCVIREELISIGDIPPATDSQDERWLRIEDSKRHLSRVAARTNRQPEEKAMRGQGVATSSGHIMAIACRDSSLEEALRLVCRDAGCEVISWDPSSARFNQVPPRILVYDAHLDPLKRFEDIHRIRTHYPAASILVLIDFPRIEDRKRALEAGATDVFPKPFVVAHLQAFISSHRQP